MTKIATEYLGDGLYASYDGYEICLMAGSPYEPTNTVYLEPDVYANLIEFVRRTSPTDTSEVEK